MTAQSFDLQLKFDFSIRRTERYYCAVGPMPCRPLGPVVHFNRLGASCESGGQKAKDRPHKVIQMEKALPAPRTSLERSIDRPEATCSSP